ncbi:MAG: hypothetical protein A2Y73_03410 [Chloroflexi bacterium RBG_13_56_8]|nr:MAG: hypothetical protein A2Y73_03410 [Chloroflexi bacterium RBG_13_56_8]
MTAATQEVITTEELLGVEEALLKAAVSNVELLSTASKHMIAAGGKRVRPRLVLLAYKATGGNDVAQAIPAAAAVELLHTASLIHDDINDHSNVRRNRASINALFGNALALLIGDFVFIKLLGLIADFGTQCTQILADACTNIIEGETLQMLNLHNAEMTEDTYLQIVTQKTASLFSACTLLGAILANGAKREIGILGEYGLNLGVAFQIRDDTLDLMGEEDTLGKPVANDLGEGKLSLATLYGLRSSNAIRETLQQKDFEKTVRLLREIGAQHYAMKRAKEYAEKAKTALTSLSPSEARKALYAMVDFAIERDK